MKPRRLGVWKVRTPVVVDPVGTPASPGEPLGTVQPCANCGDTTPGNYCRDCGQARRVVHVSLREMLTDFLDDQLALNSKLPITVAFLLLRPGFLTREYLRGRIASYIRPLRLYLGASVLFFVLFSFLARQEGWGVGNGPLRVNLGGSGPDSAAVADSVHRALGRAGVAPTPPAPQRAPGARAGTDSSRRVRRTGAGAPNISFSGMGELSDSLNAKYRRLKEMRPAEMQRALLDGVQDQGPRAMFLMLPIFAGILKLLYARSKRYYVEHFVFALHFHACVFLLLTIFLGLQEIPGANEFPAGAVLWLWSFIYLFVAMKKVYAQGIFRTWFKFWMLFWSYALTLCIGFVLTTVAIVYFM
jgi:hypothetical protein